MGEAGNEYFTHGAGLHRWDHVGGDKWSRRRRQFCRYYPVEL